MEEDERLRKALADRDMEWWEALALNDGVAPTPEAVKDYLSRLSRYEQDQARKKEREDIVRLIRLQGVSHDPL